MNLLRSAPRTLRRPFARRTAGTRLPSLLATLLLGAMLPAHLLGQDLPPSETIRSDRPGLGDGAGVVGTGIWQAEVGVGLEHVGEDEFLAATGLLRLGLKALELRLAIPTLTAAQGDEDLAIGDLGVGVKVPLADRDGWTMALTGGVTLPTSTLPGATDEVGGSAAFLAETALADDVGLAVNAGYGFLFDDVGDGTLSLIATPSVSLGDGVSAYAGYAGYFSDGEDVHIIEGGMAWLRGGDAQWDVNAGFDPDTDRWFLGAGYATRW